MPDLASSGEGGAESGASLDEQTYRRLRAALIAGVFSPGEKLSIRQVADRFGTSAMPARIALRRLAAEQAIDILPSGSARVPRLSREAFSTLSAIRAELEPMAVRMAAAGGAPSRHRLAALLDAQERAQIGSDPAAMLRADRDFLFTIYRACSSPLLLQFIEALWLRRGPLFWEARWMLLSRTGQTHQHAQMIVDLGRRDGEAAAAALRLEIEAATAFLLDNYDFAPGEASRRRSKATTA